MRQHLFCVCLSLLFGLGLVSMSGSQHIPARQPCTLPHHDYTKVLNDYRHAVVAEWKLALSRSDESAAQAAQGRLERLGLVQRDMIRIQQLRDTISAN